MRPRNKSHINLSGHRNHHTQRVSTPWYWRLIALGASWMILAGYLMMSGLYAKHPQLNISQSVLSVFVVALLTAGYSFTALLCFACRDDHFQADGVFVPALTSSAVGVSSIAYNFILSHANVWGTAAITGTVISITSTVIYAMLVIWKRHRIVQNDQQYRYQHAAKPNLWSEQFYYSNFLQNMYPTAYHPHMPPHEAAITEDDRVNQQMALLLTKSDRRPRPDVVSATFRIDLPEDREQQYRQMYSQELTGTPGQTAATPSNRSRAESMLESLGEEQPWQPWADRGRVPSRQGSWPNRLGTQSNASTSSRPLSREERRREIEMGLQ